MTGYPLLFTIFLFWLVGCSVHWDIFHDWLVCGCVLWYCMYLIHIVFFISFMTKELKKWNLSAVVFSFHMTCAFAVNEFCNEIFILSLSLGVSWLPKEWYYVQCLALGSQRDPPLFFLLAGGSLVVNVAGLPVTSLMCAQWKHCFYASLNAASSV